MKSYQQLSIRIPTHSKERFSTACRLAGRSVTAVILSLMDWYVVKAASDLAASNERWAAVDQELSRRHIANSHRDTEAPAMGWYDAHQD